jgi:hypothetical protein
MWERESAIPSIVKKIPKSLAVLLLQQERRVVRIILAMRGFSCDTTRETNNQHKNQQILHPAGR